MAYYVAPLCFLHADPAELYATFRAMWVVVVLNASSVVVF
jgi:hypothetical protein